MKSSKKFLDIILTIVRLDKIRFYIHINKTLFRVTSILLNNCGLKNSVIWESCWFLRDFVMNKKERKVCTPCPSNFLYKLRTTHLYRLDHYLNLGLIVPDLMGIKRYGSRLVLKWTRPLLF